MIAYIGAAESLMAKHVFMPMSKYHWCLKALEKFKEAIAASPGNLEIRYLRLAIQVNLPSILHMSGDIPEDKQKILSLLPSSTDESLNHDISTFMLQHRHLCTPSEQEILKTYVR